MPAHCAGRSTSRRLVSLVSILLSLVILCKLSAVAGQRTSRAAATVPARTSTEAREPTRGSTTTANWRTRGGDEATRGPTTSFVRGTAPPLATRVTTTSAFRTRNPGATTTTGRRGGGGGDSGNTVRTRAPLTTTRQPGITRPADASAVTRPAGDPSDSRSGTGAVRGTTSEAAARVYSSHNGRDGRTTPLVTRPSTASAGDLGGGGSSDRTPSVAVVVEVPSSTTAGAEWGVETRGQPQGEVREGTETMLPRSTPLLPAVERTTEAMAGTRYFIGMSSDSGRAPIEETQPRPGSSATVSLSSEELFRRDLTMPAVTRTSQSDPVTRAGPPSVPGSRPTQEHGGTDHRGPAVSDRSMSPALDVTRYQTEPVGTRETVTVADVTRAVGWTLFHDRTPRTVDLRTESISRSPTATAALTGQSQSVSASTHRATPDAPVSEDKFSRTSPAVSITGHSSSLFTSRRVEESTGTVGVSTHSGFDTSTELPQVRTSVHSPTAAVTAFPTHWVTESTASSGKPSTAVATSASTRWSVESPAPTTTPIDSYSHSTSAAIQVSHATSDEGSAFDSTATSISGSMPMTTIDVSSAPTKTTSQLPVVTITSGQVGQTSPQTEGGSCQGVCSSGTNRVANGKCNNGNNNCGCGWDGGDCCLPSVTPDQFSNCGGSPELCCLDPTGVSSVLTTAAVEATTDTCTRLACVLLSFIHLHSLFTQHSPLLLHLERNGLFVDQILVSSAGLETGPLASVQDTVALALVIDGYTLETLDATVQAQLTAGLVAYFDDEVFQGLAVVHDDDVAIVAVSVAARRLLLRVPAGLGRGLQEQSVQVDVHISLPIMTVSEFIASQGTPVASTLGQQASTSTAEPSNSTGSQQGFVVELSREEVIAIASVGAAIILLTILALGIALCCRVRSEKKKIKSASAPIAANQQPQQQQQQQQQQQGGQGSDTRDWTEDDDPRDQAEIELSPMRGRQGRGNAQGGRDPTRPLVGAKPVYLRRVGDSSPKKIDLILDTIHGHGQEYPSDRRPELEEELRKLARSPVGLRMAEAMNAPLEDFDDHGDGVDYATTLRRYFESVDKTKLIAKIPSILDRNKGKMLRVCAALAKKYGGEMILVYYKTADGRQSPKRQML